MKFEVQLAIRGMKTYEVEAEDEDAAVKVAEQLADLDLDGNLTESNVLRVEEL